MSYNRLYETTEMTDYSTKDKKSKKYRTRYRKIIIKKSGSYLKKRVKRIKDKYSD